MKLRTDLLPAEQVYTIRERTPSARSRTARERRRRRDGSRAVGAGRGPRDRREPAAERCRESVYTSLVQTHLPKLEELGVIEYDRETQRRRGVPARAGRGAVHRGGRERRRHVVGAVPRARRRLLDGPARGAARRPPVSAIDPVLLTSLARAVRRRERLPPTVDQPFLRAPAASSRPKCHPPSATTRLRRPAILRRFGVTYKKSSPRRWRAPASGQRASRLGLWRCSPSIRQQPLINSRQRRCRSLYKNARSPRRAPPIERRQKRVRTTALPRATAGGRVRTAARYTRYTAGGDDFVARTARLDDPLFQLYRPLTSRAPLDEQPERTEHAAPGRRAGATPSRRDAPLTRGRRRHPRGTPIGTPSDRFARCRRARIPLRRATQREPVLVDAGEPREGGDVGGRGRAGTVGGGLGGSDRLARHRPTTRRTRRRPRRAARRGASATPTRTTARTRGRSRPASRPTPRPTGGTIRRRPPPAARRRVPSEQPQRAPGEVALREFGRAGHEVAAEPDRCERDGEDDRAEFDRDQRADGDCADRGDRDVDDRAGETAVFAGVLWTPKPAERGVGIV